MFLILLTSVISMAWAGDDPPTPMSNKEAIATGSDQCGLCVDLGGGGLGVFYAGRVCFSGNGIYAGQECH